MARSRRGADVPVWRAARCELGGGGLPGALVHRRLRSGPAPAEPGSHARTRRVGRGSGRHPNDGAKQRAVDRARGARLAADEPLHPSAVAAPGGAFTPQPRRSLDSGLPAHRDPRLVARRGGGAARYDGGMKAPATYAEGSKFTGRIERTASASEPAWPQPPRARAGAPNVLVFLLDDVGFAQLGCYGSDIRTPNFDRLAAGGVRYRDFHTTAICSPTRACLLTGRNHHSNGVGTIQEMATGFPGYNGMVPKENGFLSEMLLAQGYATLGIGKWHLTLASEYASGASKARWPLSRGFERFYGFIGGKTNHWVPTLVHDSHYIDPPRTPEEGYHLNDKLG